MQPVTPTPQRPRRLEFGIYRDGDNNLDAVQENVVAQAAAVTARDSRIACSVLDTTRLRGNALESDRFDVVDGRISHARRGSPQEMSSGHTLASFVAHTLDEAEARGAKETWIDLVDHGGGDGGGLQTSDGRVMPMPEIARAIAQGVAMHAQAHPEDADRRVDGVVANQCLMATLGFADALSHAGVRYLAASPETMVAPGVPTNAAEAIAAHAGDPRAMGAALVGDVMHARYGFDGVSWGPAAAFDVLDLDRSKMCAVEASVKRLDDDIAASGGDRAAVDALRDDARAVPGMVRFRGAPPDMPWHADRPAIELYDTIARDDRLDAGLRTDAAAAASSVDDLVVAHEESRSFGPFGGRSYADAVGPTTHFPVSAAQVDPWAPKISETHNRFFDETDAAAAEGVIA
ncbi:MAG: hypothetical protein ACREMP_02210 [Candidatus Tyrphobacter sp.]